MLCTMKIWVSLSVYGLRLSYCYPTESLKCKSETTLYQGRDCPDYMDKCVCFDCGIEFEARPSPSRNIYCGNDCAKKQHFRIHRGWKRGDFAKIMRVIQKYPNITANEIIRKIDSGKRPYNVVAKFNNTKIAKGAKFLFNTDAVRAYRPKPRDSLHYEIVSGNSVDEWLNPRFVKD